VVQGLELCGAAAIAYCLGNFVANDVYFSDGDVLTWNRAERTGCVLLAELDAGGVRDVRQVATRDTGRAVGVDRSGRGQRLIRRANRAIARGVTWRRYRRQRLWVKAVRPALRRLRWSRLKRLRPRHVGKALGSLRRGRSSR
jgi:poly-gamma-glutamate synthesis protein (capsule biosynthesis protein)